MMIHLNIGLTDDAREQAIGLLTQYLADTQVLANKTQGFHWNVRSTDFAELHGAFEAQYDALFASIDKTAERIRMLGAYAPASLSLYAERTQLETAHDGVSDQDMLKWLVGDHELLIKWLRDAIKELQALGDEGNADYFIGRLRFHEKTAWLLRSSVG